MRNKSGRDCCAALGKAGERAAHLLLVPCSEVDVRAAHRDAERALIPSLQMEAAVRTDPAAGAAAPRLRRTWRETLITSAKSRALRWRPANSSSREANSYSTPFCAAAPECSVGAAARRKAWASVARAFPGTLNGRAPPRGGAAPGPRTERRYLNATHSSGEELMRHSRLPRISEDLRRHRAVTRMPRAGPARARRRAIRVLHALNVVFLNTMGVRHRAGCGAGTEAGVSDARSPPEA